MNVATFKQCIKKYNKLRSPSHKILIYKFKTIGEYTIKEYQKKAEKIKEINFKCNFKNDICRLQQDQNARYTNFPDSIEIKSCCHGCRATIGYFNKIHSDNLTYLAHLFNENTGFWRKGKGCILPHKYRSPTCLGYMCQLITYKMKKSDVEFLHNFSAKCYERLYKNQTNTKR